MLTISEVQDTLVKDNYVKNILVSGSTLYHEQTIEFQPAVIKLTNPNDTDTYLQELSHHVQMLQELVEDLQIQHNSSRDKIL